MIAQLFGQAAPIDRLFGIRDRFASGGSTQGFVTVLLLVVLAFFVLLLIAMLARRWRRRKVYNPRSLFLDVLREIPLTVPQRDLLRHMARELRLEHPTVLLLSPRIYHEHANAWMSGSRNASLTMRDRIDTIAQVLYEDEAAE